MTTRRWFGVTLMVLAVAASACEKLGLDPSGRLACSTPPKSACPGGFFCSAGRCWRNGSLDGAVEASAGDTHADLGSADQQEETAVDGPEDSPTGVEVSADVSPEASGGDVRDAPADVPTETGLTCRPDACNSACHNADVAACGSTCKVCPAPAANGHATCDGTSCGIGCDTGYRNCAGTQLCVRNTACCVAADCPATMPACVNNVCKPRALDEACTGDGECGSGHCAPTAAGASTKVCCDSACSGSCNDGCAGGTCQHKKFRTSCGEIDNSYYGPRYYLCDGNGNCNPPAFPCGGGSACAAKSDVACCGDPNNNFYPACVAPAVCGQGPANFEQSCNATIDCPLGTFCCVIQNPDMQLTACAANCQTYAPVGVDPTSYGHAQACDYVRDSSCPAGQHCNGADAFTGVSQCGP